MVDLFFGKYLGVEQVVVIENQWFICLTCTECAIQFDLGMLGLLTDVLT